jgi:hypothetical protein
MFNYPEAVPIRFDQEYNGDRIEITLQYERLVKPGEQPHIKVGFKTSSRRRIAAVCLRITAHDNVVVDVQPRSREIGPERKSEVATTKVHEKKRRWKAGAGGGFHQMARLTLEGSGENTGSHYTTESGTRSSTATIIGQPMRTLTDDDTADWNLNEAKTSYGGDGIKGYDEGLSFSLLEMPHRFSYECWVTFVDSDGRERKYHKSSYGFWGKYTFRLYPYYVLCSNLIVLRVCDSCGLSLLLSIRSTIPLCHCCDLYVMHQSWRWKTLYWSNVGDDNSNGNR